MDIERIKKLLSSGIEAGKKVKAVREVIKTYNTRKQDMYDDTSEILKPSLDFQKEMGKQTDKKQDEIIKQLKENQENLVEAIEFDPTKAITWEGEKLPNLDWHHDDGEDEGEDDGEDKEVKPSSSEKKPQIINLDKGITPEYESLLEDIGLPLPSKILNEGSDPNQLITKVNNKIKRQKDYIKSHSTKKVTLIKI